MKIQHREWTIDSVPQKQGRLWHACVEVERGPWEHESLGQIYHFTDIGYYEGRAEGMLAVQGDGMAGVMGQIRGAQPRFAPHTGGARRHHSGWQCSVSRGEMVRRRRGHVGARHLAGSRLALVPASSV